MTGRRIELTVGLFVVIGAACLIYLSLMLGQVGWFGAGEYEVYAEFDSVEGLLHGATVEVAGVQVGRVGRIELVENRARVQLRIKMNIKLDQDVICSIRTKGVIGEKFLRLEPGGSDKLIPPGGKIRETVSGVDIMDLVSQFIQGNIWDSEARGQGSARGRMGGLRMKRAAGVLALMWLTMGLVSGPALAGSQGPTAQLKAAVD
ncbi:MAG: outer membrane lipid asymmetry maintenance protein MlaD, partial [Deltaproteobacteria bacterium]|nr:outer membrane lipid asymmetry maintenance protein MlaD [Deltaproteobacteria bacterium]